MRVFFSLLLICLSIAITGCASTQAYQATETINDPILQGRAKPTAFQHDINHVLNLVARGQLVAAQQAYDGISNNAKDSDGHVLLAYTQAKLSLAKNDLDTAYAALNNPAMTQHNTSASQPSQLHIALLNSEVLTQKGLYLDAVKQRTELASFTAHDKTLADTNNNAIWQTLNKTNLDNIKIASQNAEEGDFKEWLALNIIARDKETALDERMAALKLWQMRNAAHPATSLEIAEIVSIKEQAIKEHEKIAVLLPLNGKYSAIADAISDGIMRSYYESGHQAQIHFYPVGESDQFLAIYKQAVDDGAKLVIGPLFKNQLEELYTLDALPVRTIALNKLDTAQKPANLFEFSLAPEDEIFSMIEHINHNQRSNIFIMAQKDDFSQKNLHTFMNAWQDLGHPIIASHSFSETTELAIELEKPLNLQRSKQRIENLQTLLGLALESNPKSRTDIDAVVLFTKPEGAREINTLLEFYFPDNIARYANSSIYRGFPAPGSDKALDGIVFTDVPLAIVHSGKLTKKYINSPLVRMYAFGMDAFLLSNHLQSQGYANTHFDGMTGKITLSNGQLSRKTSFAVFSDGIAQPLPNIETIE